MRAATVYSYSQWRSVSSGVTLGLAEHQMHRCTLERLHHTHTHQCTCWVRDIARVNAGDHSGLYQHLCSVLGLERPNFSDVE